MNSAMQRQSAHTSGATSRARSLASGRTPVVHSARATPARLLLNLTSATSVLAPSTSAATPLKDLEYEVDRNGLTRAKYEREGWNYWTWDGLRVHYAQAGKKGNPVVLLIHGYGASAYHWRYQFKEFADAGYNVYAMDLMGFGLSEKAQIDYSNGKPWVSQIAAFVEDVIGGGPVVIVGNSLGAYASLAAAAAHPDLISAVAMLNGAGPFRSGTEPPPPSPLDPIKNAVVMAGKRVALFFGFLYAKQPLRIKQVLDLVYVSKDQIDQDLVTSIQVPAQDPKASDVFFRINNQQGKAVYVDDLLEGFEKPLLLLWGEADPWIVPSRALKVQAMYPEAELKFIPSGHCPHDDTPELANEALLAWMQGLPKQQGRALAGASIGASLGDWVRRSFFQAK